MYHKQKKLTRGSDMNLYGTCIRNTNGAFTLVELLVVIAVTALLLSMLMPACTRARGQAKLVVCRTRLHSICLGALMYSDDNDSYLPYSRAMLGPPHNSSDTGLWIDNPHTQMIEELLGYVPESESYFCPAWKHPLYSYSQDNFEAGNIGYFYFSVQKQPSTNGSLANFLRNPKQDGPITYPRRLRSVMHSANWVASDLWFSGKTMGAPEAHRGYKKGVNYVVLDGSVRMVKQSPRADFR
ncbi:MAG: type II secretion system protein [Phycisphaerales bacterium]|nr:MAG: type II secretion system protein [Phycisphaerales bacterium]